MPILSSGRGICLHPAFLVLAAAMLMIVPIRWLFGWMLAAGIHELGHYLMLKLFRVPVYGIKFGSAGIIMETGEMSGGAELLCAAAGPCAGLLLLVAAKRFPFAAVCAYVQSVFNMLPIGDSDGGRILRCISSLLFPSMTSEKIVRVAEFIVTGALVCLSFYSGLVLRLGAIPVIGGALLLFRCLKVKIPCKDGKQRVQYSKRKWKGMQL